MSNLLYRLTCLTNLHMGSGDVNYSVIDLEVERDPVLEEPTMNASGVKGALRDYCEGCGASKEDVEFIFGSEQGVKGGTKQGSYHFFSGDLLARPVRVSEGQGAYLLATTPDLLKTLLRKLHAFGLQTGFAETDLPALPENKVLSPTDVKEVESLQVQKGDCPKLTKLLGTERWVLMSAQQLKDIDLPVLAHNVLEDGISKNLWYEQVVPHESVFLLLIQGPDGDKKLETLLPKETGTVVQFGAGATTGNGFTLLECLEG